jgi:hypothetical protein
MLQAIKRQVIVQPGGRIELTVAELEAGTSAEVVIIVPAAETQPRRLTSFLGKGRGAFATPGEADAFLRAEREGWQ